MTPPKLRVDFNGLFGDMFCLSHGDSGIDANGATVRLVAGMVAIAFDIDVENGQRDDLIASGIGEQSPPWLTCNGSRWILKIDSNGVRHESELTSDATHTVSSD